MIKILLLALFCNLGHAASAPEESVADQLSCGITKSQITKLGGVLPNGMIINFLDANRPLNVRGCNDGNITEVISALITHASGLKLLDLAFNKLSTLPPEIGKLSALTYLTLFNNHLTILPAEFGSLVNLKALDLTNNRLTTLPPYHLTT